MTPQALLALYRPDLAVTLHELAVPAYRHTQVCEHLFGHPGQLFSQATTLPGDMRVALESVGTSTLTLVESRTAPDGTTKFLLATHDGLYLETVLMRYQDHMTVCLSSQIGCPVGCAFCATGAMGFRRNLMVAEIVDQVRAASALTSVEGKRLSNIVYMGMGEPLLNLQAVLDSIRVITDTHGFGLAHRAVSVSTIGIPNGILRLGRFEPQVNLALSLHAADDKTRSLLVPKSFFHPVSQILQAAWEHFSMTHRKLLVEYVLLRGVNDSIEEARRLAGLLHGHVVTVNLLAWNTVPPLAPHASSSGRYSQTRSQTRLGRTDDRTGAQTGVPCFFEPSSQAAIAAFRDALLKAGVETVVRHSKGSGIQAACGQLAGRKHCLDPSVLPHP